MLVLLESTAIPASQSQEQQIEVAFPPPSRPQGSSATSQTLSPSSHLLPPVITTE